MPFQSQFALSLELTKFLPLGPIVNAGGEAILNIARELRRSGSDIVVEEDLAAVFGRNRLEPRFESSFKTAVRTSEIHPISKYLDIVLEAGAGPTVRRSLTDRAHFATIVQLSLLAYTHDIESLANGLSRALEKRLEGSSPGQAGPTPDYEGLGGTLKACGDQTSAFRWHLILDAVEAKIRELPYCSDRHEVKRGIDYIVLLGLLDFLPSVLYLPEDRIISIQCVTGFSTIIAWAHHVLGLTVQLSHDGRNITFGSESPNVIVSVGPAAIAMLDAEGDDLFRLEKDNADDAYLTGALYWPLLGFGVRFLEAYIANNISENAHEFAEIVLWNCSRSKVGKSVLDESQNFINRKIQHAVQVIFNDETIGHDTMADVLISNPNESLDQWIELLVLRTNQPSRLSENSVKWAIKILEDLVNLLLPVSTIHECYDLPIRVDSLKNLNGDTRDKDLVATFEAWSKIMGCDEVLGEYLERASAFTARGWTVLLGTIGAIDPTDRSIYSISIVRGVPSRRGERKHWIVDGPKSLIWDSMKIIELPGSSSTLRCVGRVVGPKQFVAVRRSAFEVLQMYQKAPQGDLKLVYTLGVGFREMLKACRSFRALKACGHAYPDDQTIDLPGDETTLLPGAFTFDGCYDYFYVNDKIRSEAPTALGLTAGVPSSRWLLLCSMYDVVKEGMVSGYLRGQDCCYQCAVNQACEDEDRKVVVL